MLVEANQIEQNDSLMQINSSDSNLIMQQPDQRAEDQKILDVNISNAKAMRDAEKIELKKALGKIKP